MVLLLCAPAPRHRARHDRFKGLQKRSRQLSARVDIGATIESSVQMNDSPSCPVTMWLEELNAGDASALDRLVPVLYEELRSVARRQLRHEPHITLSATGLVHEAYLRLLQQRQISAGNRETFLAVVARVMRRVLVDHARRRRRLKRGGQGVTKSLATEAEPALLSDSELDEVVALDELLTRLAAASPRASRIAEYRIFAGLTLEETAAALGTSTKTVQRSWAMARAWLRKEVEAKRISDAGAEPAVGGRRPVERA